MAIRNKITDEQERLFEQELLHVLRRDPDHQFVFDGKLRVWSSRYNCELKAVSVHLDEKGNDIVFVGAFIQGKPQMDVSKGYPLIRPELSIPFRECFIDLKFTPGFNESYLISKTRKAVLDKCVLYPMRLLDANGCLREGGVGFSDFEIPEPSVNRGTDRVGSVRIDDAGVEITLSSAGPSGVGKLSIADIQRVGERLAELNDTVRKARKIFIRGKNSVLPALSTTLSERDVREAEVSGLLDVYDAGFPLPCCNAVAKTFSLSYKDVFDGMKHTPCEIDRMVREFRQNGKPFGFNVKKTNNQNQQL